MLNIFSFSLLRRRSFLILIIGILVFAPKIQMQSLSGAAAAAANNQFKIKYPTFNQMDGYYDASSMRTADFNNDGINDIALTLPSDGKIAVQLGDGEGRLGAFVYFAAGTNPRDLVVVDFNADGELDIVTANTSTGRLSLLLGDGAGAFAFNSDFSSNGTPQLLTTGNFNQDSYPDIVVANNTNLTIFYGTGTTDFTQAAQSTATFYTPVGLAQGDFDCDGKIDIAETSYSGDGHAVKVWKNNGNGTFTALASFDLESYGITAQDFNNDTFVDLLINDYRTASVKVFLGDGAGGFAAPISSPSSSIYGYESADFNADGNLDLVAASGSLLLGNGTGRFTAAANSAINGYAKVVVGDFNSDALPDAVVIAGVFNPSNGTAVIVNKNGRFEVGANGFAGYTPYAIASADFNLDGRPDAAIADAYNNSVHVLLQDGSGNFYTTNNLGIGFGTGGYNVGPYSVTVGDFNGDGKPDIASPNSFARRIVILLGDGTGAFTLSNVILPAEAQNPSFIRVGDFNNDNKQDLVTMNRGTRNFSILLGDGAGAFPTVLTGQTVGAQQGFNLVTVGDFNSDGKQDLIVGRFWESGLLTLLGNGDGTFITQLSTAPSPQYALALASADFNNDGKLDVAVGCNETNGTLNVLFGNGTGLFNGLTTYPMETSPSDVAVGDFDLDGIKDLITSNGPSKTVILYKGGGSGTFAAQPPITVSSSPYALTAKDFNNDGKLDIAMTSRFGGGANVFLNDTSTLSSSLSVNDVAVAEGNTGSSTNARFTISLSAPTVQPVSVNYKIAARTASPISDYQVLSGQIIFPAGSVSQLVDVRVEGDAIDEDNETFVLSLSNATNADIADSIGTGTVVDDDFPPAVSFASAGAAEGNTGNVEIAIPAALSAASGRKVKIQYATADGTATAPNDYSAAAGILFFSPGETAKNLSVKINPDTLVEPNETFAVNFSNPTNVVLNGNQATGTVLNDDIGGVVQFAGATFNVNENGGSAIIIVTRAAGSASGIVVPYSTGNGTALAGQDYTAVSGNITFGTNETSKTFIVPIISDTLNEETETVNVSIGNVTGGATGGNPSNTVLSILDDDPLPQLRISNVSVNEGNQGTANLLLTVDLTAASGRSVTVNFATTDSTATAPDDYQSISGSLNFAPGETGKTIAIPIVGDSVVEPNENFQVSLSNPVNATLSNAAGIITILNDDFRGSRAADYDGDGRADVSVFRPSIGAWYLNRTTAGYTGFGFGQNGDLITPADYDGDGKTDVAVFRAGNWYRLNSSNGQFVATQFGTSGDLPVAGDFDGDGRADLSVFRPSNGAWYRLNSSNGEFFAAQFGQAGDKPQVADYDGDGKTDLAVFRPSNGGWYYLRSSDSAFYGTGFGQAGDIAAAADFDGDSKADIAVFRPSNGTWYRLNSSNGQFVAVQFGQAGDIPTAADFDGDTKADISVFRPSNGTWYLLRTTAGFTALQFGANGDIPTPSAFGQ